MPSYSDVITDIISNGTRYHKPGWVDGVRLFRVYLDADGFKTDATGTAVVGIGDSTGSNAFPWQPDEDDKVASDYELYTDQENNQGW